MECGRETGTLREDNGRRKKKKKKREHSLKAQRGGLEQIGVLLIYKQELGGKRVIEKNNISSRRKKVGEKQNIHKLTKRIEKDEVPGGKHQQEHSRNQE